MAIASLMHMSDSVNHLHKIVFGDLHGKSPKLLKIIRQLSSFEALNCHGVVDMQFLLILSVDDTRFNNFDKLDDVWMALNALEHMSIIHEDYFLVVIRFVKILEVWVLDDL